MHLLKRIVNAGIHFLLEPFKHGRINKNSNAESMIFSYGFNIFDFVWHVNISVVATKVV